MIRIGISGWTYAPWRRTFYPVELSQKKELGYASSVLSSIEINGTFYSLQRPTSYAAWYEQTPAGFVFSVKATRFVTHIKRLREIEAPAGEFFCVGRIAAGGETGTDFVAVSAEFSICAGGF